MARFDSRSILRWWILLLPPVLLVVALSMLTGDVVVEDEPLVTHPTSDRNASLEDDAILPPAAPTRAPPARALIAAESTPGAVPDSDVPRTTPTGLAGRVLDESGRAIAGATVALTSAAVAGPAAVQTDGAGRFQFAAVPAGELTVSAEASGCGPAWVNDVTAGTWIELRLPAAAHLTVEVRGAAEDLVADAVVRVRRPGFEREAVTDAEGRAVFEALPAGPAEVRVRAANGATAGEFLILDAQRPAEIVCALQSAGILRGRVIAAGSGQPVTGARVTVRDAQAPNVADSGGVTAEDGTFEFAADLSRGGHVEVSATKDGYAEGRITLRDRSAPFAIVLVPQRSLQGRVIDTRGRAVASARIAWAESFGDETRAVSDVRGRFRVLLPPAPYEGRVHAITATTAGGGYGAAAVRLGLADESIVVIVRGGGTLSGSVHDGGGRALPGALVTLEASSVHVPTLAESGDEAWARNRGLTGKVHLVRAVSDADGYYRLPRVPAGAWAVRVVRGAADERLREPVLIHDGADLSLELTVGAVDALRGRVVDAQGVAVAGARVLAVPSSDDPTAPRGRVTTSGVDGHYRLDALHAEAPVDLVVSASGYAPQRLEGVVPGGRALDIRLAPAARITGRVEQAGVPYGGPLELWLVSALTDSSADEASGGIPVPAQRLGLARSEDTAGRFALDLPHAGAWLVCARVPGGAAVAAPVPVDVEAGQGVADLLLRLDAAATLRGRMRLEARAGDPSGATVSVHAWVGHEVVTRPLTATHARADGTFELRDLPAGEVRLRVQGPDGETIGRDLTLARGTVFEVDLDLADVARP